MPAEDDERGNSSNNDNENSDCDRKEQRSWPSLTRLILSLLLNLGRLWFLALSILSLRVGI